RGVHLVQDAERAGPAAEDGQQQRHAGQRLFAAAQQRDVARLLAWRPGDDLDAAVENVDPFVQDDVRLPTAEQLAKQRLKVTADHLQRVGEQPAAVGVDLADNLLKRSLGARQVLVLAGEVVVARLELVQLGQGVKVDAADAVEL